MILCIMASIKEFRYSNQHEEYAKHVSIVTLLLNAAWNCTIFIWQFIVATQGFNTKTLLINPTMILFFYINIFQMQMLVYIWRSHNAESIMQNNTSENNAIFLFIFNCKIYFIMLFGTFLVFNLLEVPELLLIYLSILWIPQIIQNMRNSHSRAPSIFYTLSVTVQHLYVPVHYHLTVVVYNPN